MTFQEFENHSKTAKGVFILMDMYMAYAIKKGVSISRVFVRNVKGQAQLYTRKSIFESNND